MICSQLAPPDSWSGEAWADHASHLLCLIMRAVAPRRKTPPRLYKIPTLQLRKRLGESQAVHAAQQIISRRCISLPCGNFALAGRGGNRERDSWIVLYRAEDLETREWLCELQRRYEIAEAVVKTPELLNAYLRGQLPPDLAKYAVYIHVLLNEGKRLIIDENGYVLVNRSVKLAAVC